MSGPVERSGESGFRLKICSVPKCFNSRATCFELPAEMEKRKKWLKLINREDLKRATTPVYVCENHFESSTIQPSSSEKTLKRDAVPKLKLPKIKQTQNRIKKFFNLPKKSPEKIEKGVQTEVQPLEAPRTEDIYNKMLGTCLACRKRKKCSHDDWADFETFSNLCDKFLSKNIANAMKQNAVFLEKP